MAKVLCKATTSSGAQCRLKANKSGYCHIHDPVKVAARAKDKRENGRKSSQLSEVINVILCVCEAKGWHVYVQSCDRSDWQYATISVRRTVQKEHSDETITGVLDVSVHNGVRVSPSKTSFYGYGLDDLHCSVMTELGKLPWLKNPDEKKIRPQTTSLGQLTNVLLKFRIVATQLSRRHEDRDTLIINDEYDTQDLLHALLKSIFSDVRREDPSPTRAGASSRPDFLLKAERIVVEVKMSNKTLTDRKIGEQLIVDIERYKSHPDCNTLVCLVYDPKHNIRNPAGLEKDLTRETDGLNVVVMVVPS